jgi:hypothetical protein
MISENQLEKMGKCDSQVVRKFEVFRGKKIN